MTSRAAVTEPAPDRSRKAPSIRRPMTAARNGPPQSSLVAVATANERSAAPALEIHGGSVGSQAAAGHTALEVEPRSLRAGKGGEMAAGPVNYGRSGVSRYNQLATIFRRNIESGEWPIDAQIPTVLELSEEWQVAPATIRQALDVLENAGLIARFRAKGTFVIKRPQLDLWCEVPTDWTGLLLSPDGVEIEVLATETNVQPLHVAHQGGILADNYRHWRRRHSRQGQRYYIGDAYVAEKWAKKISQGALTSKTTLRALKELKGLHLAEVYQTLTVREADLDLHEMLDVALNSPIVHVSRTVLDDAGNIVFVGDGMYRGDVVRLDIKVSD
jgi:GntR family transcriptional regulator